MSDQEREKLEAVKVQVPAVVEVAQSIVVQTQAHYEIAARFLQDNVKAVRQEIDNTFDPIIKAAHTAHKEAIAQKKRFTDPLDQAERHVKGLMGDYYRREEEERRRKERELQRQAQEREENERLERAALLEREGRQEEANALIEAPVEAPRVVLAEPAPKAEGVSMRETWKFRVVDKAKINPEFMVPDEVAIGKTVRAMKETAARIVGGIEVYCEKTPVVR